MNADQDQDQAAVIAFLSSAGALGAAGPAERIDTHGAIIFLAGDRVFKLKRAVRYPYLDFSSPEKRRAVCEAELTLNRRTAPDLYLDLRSVNVRADGTLGFGPGTPVDWLIVMRRFAAGDLLESVAARGGLDAALVRTLADRIAAFHADARTSIVPDGAARIGQVIAGNRKSMSGAECLAPSACDELYTASLAALNDVAALLDARGASGHVRHCHGDLHLANICLWQGLPTLFDCLEFDEALATTDVLYDLAFLLMDLWHRDFRAQASLLFNRYLDRTDEAGGVAALPLFLSMRAAIRAHVCATAAGRQADADKAAGKRLEADAYLEVARAFLDTPRPRLIVIGGLSGTGKSTLAGHLAHHIGGPPGARWLRTDVLRKRLAGIPPEERLPAEAYAAERSEHVYHRLMADTHAMLAAGRSVIVDGVFAREAERRDMAAIAADLGVPFTGLWLEAPEALLTSRVSGRRDDASDADAAVVAQQLCYDLGDLADWHRLDASGSPEEVDRRARTLLDIRGPT